MARGCDASRYALSRRTQLDVRIGFGCFGAISVRLDLNGSALDIEAWSISARISKPLISKLSANWLVGITQSQIDAGGQLTINEIVSLNPLVLNRMDNPFALPESETGFNFGFGFAWDFGDRYFAEVGYRKYDTRVIELDTVTLQCLSRCESQIIM